MISCSMETGSTSKIKFWRQEEETIFIEIWRENIKPLRAAKRNSHIYQKMADELLNLGVAASPKEVQRKVNNLTQKYRKEKTAMGKSGGSPSTWRHFKAIQQIIGHFASHDSSKIHESINLDCVHDDELDVS